MRDIIRQGIGTMDASHFGYAYQLWTPPLDRGKPDAEKRNDWLGRCERIPIPAGYRFYYARWQQSFPAGETTQLVVTTASRVLVGHGTPSGADVGLTVHRAWGTPLLPGSALKGLAAHYVDTVYGDTAAERRTWRGPTWTGRRVAKDDGAGEAFAALFGAPGVEGDDAAARRGVVEFHDALYVPRPAGQEDKPFVRDVLTVHQGEYYKGAGGLFPTDWDSPTPVGFITIQPGAQFLLVLTGPEKWRILAMKLLREALQHWGVGGKTAAGYGRMGA